MVRGMSRTRITFGQRTTTMEDTDEGTQVELANVELRQAMLRYNAITDSEDPTELAMLLAQEDRKMIVPVHRDANDPDGFPEYGSMFKHEKGVDLHVYTSVLRIPESCDAQDVTFYPFLDLIDDLMERGDMCVLHIDPGTDHAVGFHFYLGTPRMFRLKYVEELLKQDGQGG